MTTIPGPWTGTRPSIARSRLASAVSSWSAAELPPVCRAAFLCVRSAASAESASLARWRSSIKKARVVVSVPTRLRSTSASLRICTVATRATSSAMSQISIARRGRRRGPDGRLWGADMRYLQARVVCGQLDIRYTGDRDCDLEPNLAIAQVGYCARVFQRGEHPVPIAHRHHLDGRRQRRSLVDDDLPRRA